MVDVLGSGRVAVPFSIVVRQQGFVCVTFRVAMEFVEVAFEISFEVSVQIFT